MVIHQVDLQLGSSQGIKMINETYDQMVKGMCFTFNNNIVCTYD